MLWMQNPTRSFEELAICGKWEDCALILTLLIGALISKTYLSIHHNVYPIGYTVTIRTCSLLGNTPKAYLSSRRLKSTCVSAAPGPTLALIGSCVFIVNYLFMTLTE